MADAVAFSHNFMRRQSERNKLWMYIRMYIRGLDTCAVHLTDFNAIEGEARHGYI